MPVIRHFFFLAVTSYHTAALSPSSTQFSSSASSPSASSKSTSKEWYLEHGCVPYSDPDFNGNSVCQCDDYPPYPQNNIALTPSSLYKGVCYATAPPTKTTQKVAQACPVYGPTNCLASAGPDIQEIIEHAKTEYEKEMLSNCTNLQYHYGYPGPNAQSVADRCNQVFPIGDHMKWWWSVNQADCEHNDVEFADCFYDKVPSHKYDASHCARLGGNWYCPKPNHVDFSGPNATLDFYVAWNIYNFAIWAQTYYTGVFQGGFLAGAQAWNMTDSFVQPDKGVPKWVEILLYCLTFAVGLISPSGWGKALPGKGGTPGEAASSSVIPGSSVWKTLGEAPWEYVLRAVQQSPPFIEHMIPKSTEDHIHAFMSAADIEAKLGIIVDRIGETMGEVARTIPGNVTAFAEWTQFGYFYTEPADQQMMTDNVKDALNAFTMSQMLQNGGFIIARQVDTNPRDFMTNKTELVDTSLINCDEYDKWGMCNSWWWNKETNTAYSLLQPDHYNEHKDWAKQLHELFEEGITDPANFFLAPQLCAIGADGSKGPEPGLQDNSEPSSVVTQCLSNVQICTWNLAGEQPEFVEKDCVFNPAYAPPECKADEPHVPDGYLGWYLYNGATGKCSA